MYHLKQTVLNAEDYPHILEISNFPVEYKTTDLNQIFAAYKKSGFDIKWVDDTHALAIFSNSKIGIFTVFLHSFNFIYKFVFFGCSC